MAGNLYGTALLGGSTICDMGCGTVFELKPETGGSWSETTPHQFQNGKDGASPYGGVVLDAAGNLFGSTTQGHGTASCDGEGCVAVYSIRP